MILDFFQLNGRVALVTGAAQGLGQGFAVALAEAGAEVVLAVRRTRDDPLLPRLFAFFFNHAFRLLVFRDFPRDGFDFALLDRKVARQVAEMPEKHSYLFGQVYWLGFRRELIHYDRERRRQGTSGWTFWSKVKYFIDAFTAFSYVPVRAASLLGICLAALGAVYACVVIWKRLAGAIPERGFSALMVVLLVVSGAQLLMMGVMGEYLWRVLEEVRPRPPFVVAELVEAAQTERDDPGPARP